MPIKLSIITINLNNVEGLRKTIESVVFQTFTDFEYIVIDGASMDGSVEAIKEYADRITYWASEPDKGIYNAMNKGILKATGEYCLFLNSGDWLVDKKVLEDFHNAKFIEDIISGNLLLWNNGTHILREAILKENLEFDHFYNNRIPHPSTFIKRNLFTQYGLYNEQYKIVSDWEFFIICLLLNNCNYQHFNRTISYYDMTGISSQPKHSILQETEKEHVFRTHLPLFYKSYKKLCEEKESYLSHETDYKDYMNLKNGKFRFIINFLLFLKNKKKQLF